MSLASTLPAVRLARLLELAPDAGTLERMLVALAVHADGAAFRSAVLLVWDRPRGLLEGRARAEAGLPGASLATVLEEARRARPPEPGPDADGLVRTLALDPAQLSGAPGEAWLRGVAVGAGGPDSPWAGLPAVGAVLLRLDGEPHALLVGEWEGEPPAEAARRLEALAALGDLGLAARRRAGESRQRARQVSAVAQMAHAAVSTLNLAEALQIAVEV
ncbi:MAG TPA: hypothetical protein VI792_00435, partial [Candidatus Eisenbacteria bacterium]